MIELVANFFKAIPTVVYFLFFAILFILYLHLIYDQLFQIVKLLKELIKQINISNRWRSR